MWTHLSTQSLNRDARDDAGASWPPMAYRNPCHVATPTPPRLLAIGAQPLHLKMKNTVRKKWEGNILFENYFTLSSPSIRPNQSTWQAFFSVVCSNILWGLLVSFDLWVNNLTGRGASLEEHVDRKQNRRQQLVADRWSPRSLTCWCGGRNTPLNAGRMSRHDLLLHTIWGRGKMVLSLWTFLDWKSLFNLVTLKQMVQGGRQACVCICVYSLWRFFWGQNEVGKINQPSLLVQHNPEQSVCVCVCVSMDVKLGR